MDNSFKTLIDPAKSVLILLPKEPNFDQVASATALFLALAQNEGKEVNIYCPTPMIVEFNKLVGVNKIKSEIGNKNLTISFANYNPQGIEKVSWDIDNGQFKLTIVPKINVTAPNQDQVIVGYAGVVADLVILVGGKNEENFPAVKGEDLATAKLIHIGISEVNISGKNIASLATSASSVSEVTANLIKSSAYKIDADIATDLLMGIEEATHDFTNKGVTADTFSLVAELMRAGGKRISQQQTIPTIPTGIPGIPSQIPPSWTEPKIFKGTSVS